MTKPWGSQIRSKKEKKKSTSGVDIDRTTRRSLHIEILAYFLRLLLRLRFKFPFRFMSGLFSSQPGGNSSHRSLTAPSG